MATDASPAQSGRVLVLDDSDIARTRMTSLLEAAGFAVESRDNAIGATSVVVRSNIDVVVTDLNMPMMRGDRFASLLRRNKQLAHVKVVLVTGEADLEELRRLAAEAGADAIVEKKALAQDLAPVVRALMRPPEDESLADRPLRVLAVDDEAKTLQIIKSRLAPLGYDVETCDRPVGTLAAVTTFDPDVVLLDVVLPLMQGPELATMIEQRSGKRRRALIFHSSLPPGELTALVQRSPVVGAIRKTGNAARFCRELADLVDEWRSRSKS